MGLSSSRSGAHPDQIHIIDRVNVVKKQIHHLVEKWARKWLHHIEDPTEFDQICQGSFHKISHHVAFGLGEKSLDSDSLIETAVEGQVLVAIDRQMREHGVKYDKSTLFSHLCVDSIYNRDFGTVTYIVSCRVKKN